MTADSASLRQCVQRLSPLTVLVLTLLVLSGCATAPVTYKKLPDAEARVAQLKPMAAPPSVSVYELSAGGVSEKRDDWTAQVTTHVTPLLAAQTGYKPAPTLKPEQKVAAEAELQEVVAMLQVVALNQIVNTMNPAMPPQLNPANRPMDYNLGRIDALLDAYAADSLLITFVRDEYSTGGRKALIGLGLLVGIVPRGGFTVNVAALMQRDGTVIWLNYAGSGGDMRTPEGSAATLKLLLAGLPSHAATKP